MQVQVWPGFNHAPQLLLDQAVARRLRPLRGATAFPAPYVLTSLQGIRGDCWRVDTVHRIQGCCDNVQHSACLRPNSQAVPLNGQPTRLNYLASVGADIVSAEGLKSRSSRKTAVRTSVEALHPLSTPRKHYCLHRNLSIQKPCARSVVPECPRHYKCL